MKIVPADLRILHYPAPALRCRAEPVEIDDTVRAVVARMLELMNEAEGLGLAAPQVGLSWRLFVTRGKGEGEHDRVYINPRLLRLGGELALHEEGCLSLPEITAEIRRPSTATIAALDLEGQAFELHDDGGLARVWQHEHDHLEGILIIDKMSPMDRMATRRAVKELETAAIQG